MGYTVGGAGIGGSSQPGGGGKDKGKGTAGGSGTKSLTSGDAGASDGSNKFGSQKTPSGKSVAAEANAAANRAKAAATENGNRNLPRGVTPLDQPKPRGATPYVEGADLLGIGVRALGGIGAAATSALTQGITGEDPTQSMLGEHLGKQVGWSADPSMTPGRDRSQRGSNRESFDQTTLSSTVIRDAEKGAAAPLPTENYSDIALLDRRKPYTSLKQMMETML